MNAYPWPGNVRELINRVHRATVNAEGRLITSADMELETPWQANALSRLEDSRERAEQHAIQDALVRYRSISRASAELGVSRMTLYRRLAKYGLKRNGPSSGLPAAETASRRSP
jgi:DNA-binding NtrC family response regulator